MTMEASTAKASPVSFPCSGCGGQMQFDSQSQGLKCPFCGKEEAIEGSGVKAVEHDFDSADESDEAQTDWGMRQQTVHCENCGGETIIPELQTAGTCAFCGSPKVLAQGDKKSFRPETVIPFQVSTEEAVASFKAWKRKRWFVPNAFKKEPSNPSLPAFIFLIGPLTPRPNPTIRPSAATTITGR